MPPFEFNADSEADTARLAEAFADHLTPGTVVSLVGDLGAGKTRFVQALAAALGAPPEAVSSPTFVLIHEYPARLPVYHFDTYRLKNLDEFYDLGAEEYFYGEGVCLVEWGDRVQEAFPDDHLRIEIEITSPTARRFQCTPTGPASAQLLQAVADDLKRT